jgi:hypothetical protein
MSQPAAVPKILSPFTLANILLHVMLLSSFVAIFFFVYGAQIEKKIVKNQTNNIVDSFTGDVQNFIAPEVLRKIQPYVNQYLQVPDMTLEDQAAAAKNQALMKKTATILGIVSGICILFILIAYFWAKKANQGVQAFSMITLLKDNFWSLFFVAITEFFFLTVIAQNYRSADPSVIKLQIIDTLQKYAQS